MAFEIYSPTFSEREETEATCAIASLPDTGIDNSLSAFTAVSVANSIPRRMPTGLAPAVTFFKPSRTIACVKTVAVVVPSPATSFVLRPLH